MAKNIFLLLFVLLSPIQAFAAGKPIPLLPIWDASNTVSGDALLFQNTQQSNLTHRLYLWDLVNLPPFGNSFVLGKNLQGFNPATGTVTSADTVLSAFNKIYANLLAIGGAPITIGTIDAHPTSDGLYLNSNVLYTQYATLTLPGMLSTGAQSVAGVKSFQDGIVSDVTGNVTGNVTGDVTGNVSGNAGTASAFDHNPTDCASGQYATSIGADGNLSCSAVPYTDVTGTPTLYNQTIQSATTPVTQRSNLNFTSNFALSDSSGSDRTTIDLASTISSDTTGNADTATAFDHNPTDCAGGEYATAIDAGGNLTCAPASSVTPADFSVGTGLSITAGTGTGAVLQALTVGIAAGYYLPTTTDQSTWNAKLASSDIGTTVQGWDADLDALKALSGTNTIYYRSAANTWSAVNIGTGLDFTGGTLSATGGGGGASSEGSFIMVRGGLGHGSTNTKVRTYSYIDDQQGTDLTYTASATNGDKITVNTDGLYIVCTNDFRSGAIAHVAITVDGSALTTNASTPLTFAQGKYGLKISDSNSESTPLCVPINLTATQVLRVQDDGNNSVTDDRAFFSVTRIGAQSDSYVYVENGNGSGSTVGRYRRWSNARVNTGSKITYADSSTAGGSFTINTAGTYLMCYMDLPFSLGIVLNDSASGTDMVSTSYAQGKRTLYVSTSSTSSDGGCIALPLAVNDVIKLKGDVASFPTDTSSKDYFVITYISSSTEWAYFENGNGTGSVFTRYRRFSNVQANTLTSAATLSQSSVAGDQFRINKSGNYAICYHDRLGSSTAVTSIDIDGKSPTSAASTFFTAVNGRYDTTIAANTNQTANSCFIGYLKRGRLISFTSDGNNNTGTSSYAFISYLN